MIALDKKSKTQRNIESFLLQRSVKLVRGLGTSFNVWLCDNNKSNNVFEFTALNRNARLKVLKAF